MSRPEAHYPRLFEPIRLGPLEARNRIMMTTHGGQSGERGLGYVEARAKGGVGLMSVPGAAGVEAPRGG